MLGNIGEEIPQRKWRITQYLPDKKQNIWIAVDEPQFEPQSGALVALVLMYPEFYKRWPKHEIIVSSPYLVEEIFE